MTKFTEACKGFDARKGEYEAEIERIKAELADAQRIKNMERMTHDGVVGQQTLACTQKKVETAMRTAICEYPKYLNEMALNLIQMPNPLTKRRRHHRRCHLPSSLCMRMTRTHD